LQLPRWHIVLSFFLQACLLSGAYSIKLLNWLHILQPAKAIDQPSAQLLIDPPCCPEAAPHLAE
jgi:hypothetical protein